MELYRFNYLLLGLSFFSLWLAFFLKRKDLRKEMLIMSLIFGVAGPFADIVYLQDYWQPLSITKTKLAIIEAPLFGFVCGGVASVIYQIIFRKMKRKDYERIFKEPMKTRKNKITRIDLNVLILLCIQGSLFFGCFYLFKINSFLSTIISLIVPIIIVYLKRSDLIISSLLSGCLLFVVAAIIYTLLENLTPGWVRAFWYLKNTPDIIVFNVPLDDVVWYLLVGAYIAPLYEYWHKERLIEVEQMNK